MKYESRITCHSKDTANIKVFEKWVKLQCEGHKVKKKGLVIRNTHMKYESPIIYHSKDMANVFADRQKDGQAKNYICLPSFNTGAQKD
jgi:hypothetical protein